MEIKLVYNYYGSNINYIRLFFLFNSRFKLFFTIKFLEIQSPYYKLQKLKELLRKRIIKTVFCFRFTADWLNIDLNYCAPYSLAIYINFQFIYSLWIIKFIKSKYVKKKKIK